MANLFELNKDFIEKYWDWDANQKHPNSIKVGIGWVQMLFRCPDCGKEYVYYDTRKVAKMKELPCECHPDKYILMSSYLMKKNHQYIKEFWNYEKNKILPEEVKSSSRDKFYFKCKTCNYEWKRGITGIVDGKMCPSCSNKEVNSGFNDALTLFPDKIRQFWDWEKNNKNGIKPDKILPGGTIKIYLHCKKCGYSWGDYTASEFFNSNYGCPVCSGHRVLKGYNDFQSQYPELVDKYWDWERNKLDNVFPDELTAKSKKLVHLKCDVCGEKWDDYYPLRLAHEKMGCPFCSGQRVGKNSNSFLHKYPELVEKYWDYSKNNEKNIFPDEVTYGSSRTVFLKCKTCGGEWSNYSVKDLTVYKRGCPFCSGQRVLKGFNDLKTNFPEVVLDWDYDKNDLRPEDVTVGSNRKVWWKCHICGCEWGAVINDRTNKDVPIGCPQCAINNRPLVSKCEIEISDFIQSFYKGTIETSKRGLLSYNRELDIYIPEKRIAFEYNGIYWHSELKKDSKAHWDKKKECEYRGIKLFYIWEDQWRDKQEIVKRSIKTKLGYSTVEKINARDCQIKELDSSHAREFLDKNHIQGYVPSSKYIGLFTPEMELVSVIQFLVSNRKNNTWALTRYATSKMVRGGFTKLLKYFERKYNPDKVITFSDNDISDGNLYRINGFILEKELKENYYYTDKNFYNRYHLFNYRKSRFKNDPDLIYKEGLTERQLAKLNELYRVYDSGKKRWVKIYK